jgi:hypothetical protein
MPILDKKALVKIKNYNNAVFWIRDIPDSRSDFFHPGSRVDKIPEPDPHQRI